MNYYKYNPQTGEILARISVSEEIAKYLIGDGDNLIPAPEGEDMQYVTWVDGDQLKTRIALAPIFAPAPLPMNETVVVSSNLPKHCWLRIRGSNNMPFEERIIEVTDGVLSFNASLPGVYHAIFVGEFDGELSFEIADIGGLKARLSSAVNDKKGEVLSGGVMWNEIRWDADADSQTAITGYVSAISAGVPLPDDFFWTSYTNAHVPMSSNDVIALSGAIIGFVFKTHARGTDLKYQIETASTVADLNAIDVNTGWPV